MATQTVNMSTDSARILAHTPNDTSYFLRGDNTFTNILSSDDSETIFTIQNSSSGIDLSLKIDNTNMIHGLYSSGYYDGTTTTADGKWLIQRNSDGTVNMDGHAASATKARYVEGDDDASTPAGALLRSGSGRADASPSGDTWIYFDSLSGATDWGIKHQQANNTIDFFGGGSVTSSISLTSGAAAFTQITMSTSVQAAAASTPTALSYGRLQCYGNLFINGNTDNSGTEYVVITAGHGVSSSAADGFVIGSGAVWSNNGPIHIFPKGNAASYNEGLRCHASTGGWTTIMLCDSANTGDTGTSANSWGLFNHGGSFYITKNGSSTGSACLWHDGNWHVTGGTFSVGNQNSSTEGGEVMLGSAPSYGYYAAMDVYTNLWRIHSNGGQRFYVNLQTGAHADYAEDRKSETNEPGRVYRETNECILVKTNKRLIPGCSVCSDTYGTSIPGDEDGIPFAVSGRVLVYPEGNRKDYTAGQAVCCGPNGTVTLMTREEIKEYPDCILGYTAGIPDEKTWNHPTVELKGRIWIRLA